jgi:uncharacterized protein YecT (DUF1311 family)
MRMCWSKQDDAATAKMNRAYAALTATLEKSGANPANLARAQRAWDAASNKTCAFDSALYEGGTLAAQLGLECETRLARARTQRLAALETALQSSGKAPATQPLAPKAAAELNRVFNLYQPRLTPAQRSTLAAAERAWTTYREEACAIEGGACLTALTEERTIELEAAWVGEPFW